ncbi:unnamed protein product [Cylicocyclus nassatus]|uniref:Uncharacterized protein n=1 Tax=Cylicocyclus nassatus TaxID=53992 RepID=A0AA36GQD0_CYLNA|nr:unnamed protein product [Cylicocyclus nassatus]
MEDITALQETPSCLSLPSQFPIMSTSRVTNQTSASHYSDDSGNSTLLSSNLVQEDLQTCLADQALSSSWVEATPQLQIWSHGKRSHIAS